MNINNQKQIGKVEQRLCIFYFLPKTCTPDKDHYKTIYKGLFTLCSYLKTKESYDRWVTRRVWGFKHQISKAKYLNKNI